MRIWFFATGMLQIEVFFLLGRFQDKAQSDSVMPFDKQEAMERFLSRLQWHNYSLLLVVGRNT